MIVNNGNRTRWSPLLRVSNHISDYNSEAGVNLSITCMITDRIGWHEVLLPINHNHYNFRKKIN